MAEDPAQTFAERRQRVERLITAAQLIEDDVQQGHHSPEEAARMVVVANSRRLQAICEHLGLGGSPVTGAEPEGEDPATGGLE